MFFRIVVLWLCITLPDSAKASTTEQNIAAHPVLSSVENCIIDALTCKQVARRLQIQQPEHSLTWFRATYLLMNAMWETDRLSIPKGELASYVAIANSPPVFAAKANTLYAKQLISNGELEAGRQHADKAASLVLNMSGRALTPRRYSDIIELYQYLREYDKAQQLIDDAMAHFSDIGKNYIKADLLMAAGHNAFHFKRWHKAIALYQQSAEAHLEEQSMIGAAVAYANVGRALQSSGQWSEAQKMLSKSVNTYDKLSGQFELRDKYYIQLRLCEVLLAQSKLDEANALFATIDRDSLHAYHHDIYDQLKKRLADTRLH